MKEIRKSIKIINDFLWNNNIKINSINYIEELLIKNEIDDIESLPEDIIYRIIGDSQGFSNEVIKKIANFMEKKFHIYIGRVQKLQLKRYINYGLNYDFETFIQMIDGAVKNRDDLKKSIDDIIIKERVNLSSFTDIFLKKFESAIKSNNTSRIKDYLNFLYSKLIALNRNDKISLSDLFRQNERYIRTELDESDYNELRVFCSDNSKGNRKKIVNLFNKKYISILEKKENYEKQHAIIFLNIDQALRDDFASKEMFYNYLFGVVKKAFNEIQNHKALIIRIQNIIDNEINIKWELYAYLTVFAEKFRRVEYDKTFYKPEEICLDVLEHKFSIKSTPIIKNILRKYYKNDLDFEKIKRMMPFVNKKDMDFYKKSNAGFTFVDCFVLKTNKEHPNTRELNFIKNQNELLLIFLKYEIDRRKIPCPVCGSLRISGNSYSEIGIKSWECKNPLCSARSKTNRGKRYSKRTILMQNALHDFSTENQIPKTLINIWRKDLVEDWELKSLYEMIIKFFSYINDSILAINIEKPDIFAEIGKKQKRTVKTLNFKDFLDYNLQETNIFQNFMEKNPFFDQIFYRLPKKKEDMKLDVPSLYKNEKTVKIINEDCLQLLQKLPRNSIHNLITSPPYYNVRKYSHWKNLYNYLNEMYNVIKESHRVLCKGGVFFFNIGDIFDNEKIVVKSKMGEKRIPLGAYIILLFQKVGFTLLDNIIWYKGEPQSNRQKNDGKFTPYYQRPTNCYEHIFIFKKGGKLRLNVDQKKNILDSNIQKFSPVIKIGKDGINKYGHSAPFPSILPLFSILCFTNPSDIVLDPFSGSGTTPIVAVENQRIGIGVEIKKDYVDLSIKLAKKKKLNSLLFYKDGLDWRTSLYQAKKQTILLQFMQ